jgi:hypothetical protein
MPQPAMIRPQVVTRLIYGYHDRQRFTQDTPILLEVWHAFAARPDARHDLLITPFEDKSVLRLMQRLLDVENINKAGSEARLAPLQNFLAAKLTFDELVRHVLPLTRWAEQAWETFKANSTKDFPATAFDQAYQSALEPEGRSVRETSGCILRGTLLDAARILTLAAIIDLAQDGKIGGPIEKVEDLKLHEKLIVERIGELLDGLIRLMDDGKQEPWVWRVSNNRPLRLADEYSRATVKADAAFRLFDVKCETITWAVIDSGVDRDHPGFLVTPGDPTSGSRVVATYDFALLRDLLNPIHSPEFGGKPSNNPALATASARARIPAKEAERHLANVYQSYQTNVLDWSSIEPLLRFAEPDVPADGHGTHVAGIIGADFRDKDDPDKVIVRGMCPDIRIMDLRIISETIEDTEFAVIAALQLVRYLNSHNRYIVVHGVNLSLAIPHVVESYACGRTPVCDECDRLIGSGVSVVVAAGNEGYQQFQTEEGIFRGYATVSITDPGNCDSVITVGATHKRDPHSYGISYFSSRGPTGDGRMKPDLVAPGERIESTLPNGEIGTLDGTSQAAPHVSAAAAMLMARYPELNRQPGRIKRILCDSATDLGRERAFQGHGLLDVLRALQSF